MRNPWHTFGTLGAQFQQESATHDSKPASNSPMKALLPVALRHQHVDHLNARRVQTLMHLHGSEGLQSDPETDDPQAIDLDALLAEENQTAQADVA